MQDKDAIRRLKRGEIAALDVLVERYQASAIRAAYLVTYDTGLAQDAVQNAFINVYHKINQFDLNYEFKPWFMRIVINEALRSIRRHKRWISLQSTHWEDVLPSLDDEPHTEIEKEAIKAEVNHALRELPPEQRAAIVYKYYLGYKEAEIASETNTPRGTIKSRLNRARQKLRVLLGET